MENEEKMKELKFRVWDKEREYYLDKTELAGITPDGKYILYIEEEEISKLEIECGYILEQYTGLKDKNRKEIYEGDIVEYDWYITRDKQAYRTKEQVIFDDMGARLGNDRIRNCSNVEVIGNIHENDDLLEEKK